MELELQVEPSHVELLDGAIHPPRGQPLPAANKNRNPSPDPTSSRRHVRDHDPLHLHGASSWTVLRSGSNTSVGSVPHPARNRLLQLPHVSGLPDLLQFPVHLHPLFHFSVDDERIAVEIVQQDLEQNQLFHSGGQLHQEDRVQPEILQGEVRQDAVAVERGTVLLQQDPARGRLFGICG